MTSLRLRTRVNFPATVTGEGGFTVSKANGVWTVQPDFSALASISASAVSDPSLQQIWIWDEINDTYSVLTLSGLGDALFKLTSTTSNSIGTGSKVFTVQANKDVGVGQFVIITDDAAPSTNYMVGQITDYTTTSLTVNVLTTAGSGTKTAWTIRVSGYGATGPASGIRQTYSATTADADPGAGIFRLNNATPASATAAYLDNLDVAGSTVSGVIDLWDDSTNTTKGTLFIQKTSDASVWASFKVTGSVVDGTGYRKLTLSSGQGSGAFTAGDIFSIAFSAAGDAGSVAGPGVSVDSEIALWSGTGGATLKRATGSGVATVTSGVLGVAGTSTTATFGTIELGAASDTTISRASAGVIAVEGINVTPNIPVTSKSAAYTTVLADQNTLILHPTADNNARTFTIDSNANVAYQIGTQISFYNQINTVTISITSDTLTMAGSGSTGSRTLAANGLATATKISTTGWVISGVGLT